ILIVFGACVSFIEAQRIGYVFEIRGNWYLNGNTPLRQGQEVPASGIISTKSPGRFDYIKIADLNSKIRINQRCSQACSFGLPNAAAEPGYFSAILSTLMNLIREPTRKRTQVVARNVNVISEGIVKLENNKINLQPLLNLEGKNYLKWRKIHLESEKFGDWSLPIELKTEGGAAIVSPAGFQPGLYEFALLRKMENSFEETDSAWVLISSAEDFEKNKQSFKKVEELIENLGDEIRSETALLFRNVYLDNLARENVKLKSKSKP
ncbi:MAG TPA: hypothetical protein VK892_14420, partial [Pyrinomonadaceae bacterium]|nr:hypothetical protein [Pyrinomonadaceae bacterium]